MRIGIIRKIIGFGLKGIGFFWSFFDRFLCGNLCKNRCTAVQSNTCSLLFLFVAIIFIICGYALIVMKTEKRKALKRRIKKTIRSVRKI